MEAARVFVIGVLRRGHVTHLVALPHVADHAPHLFHVHLTVAHVHIVSRWSVCGFSVQVWGRPSHEASWTTVCSVLIVLCLTEENLN